MLNEATHRTEPIWLFPEARELPPEALNGRQVKLSALPLQQPRGLGDCWLACRLWAELSRYTQPEADQKILLQRLGLALPPQPPPRITAQGKLLT